MKAIIVGGGIGGLTTALMLRARGIDSELFEQSDGIRELGVGINTLPHAIKELAGLGLLPRLDAVGIRTYELFYCNRFGQEIWRDDTRRLTRWDLIQLDPTGEWCAYRSEVDNCLISLVRVSTGRWAGSFLTSCYGLGPQVRLQVQLLPSSLSDLGHAISCQAD
jgi:2-polyprenyl-6-methoxyphenol hydroxylase-like FAD-dependent oxidoreductase